MARMVLLVFARTLAAYGFTFVMCIAAIGTAIVGAPTWGWLQLAQRWGRGILWLTGARLVLVDEARLAGPAIFACNHTSNLDIAILPAILPRAVRFIAKRELKSVPFFGPAFGAAGAVFIDRSDPAGAVAAMRRGVETLPDGWSLAIFPEGTRSKDGGLQRFKRGVVHLALATGMPIVPIGIVGAAESWGRGDFLMRSGRVYCAVGPVIDTTTWRSDAIEEQLALVRDAVAREVARASVVANSALG